MWKPYMRVKAALGSLDGHHSSRHAYPASFSEGERLAETEEPGMKAYPRIVLSVALLGVLLSGTLASAQQAAKLADKKALTLEVAKRIAAAAEEEAVKNKWNVVIAIVDDGGSLVYLQRLDDTQIGSIEVALQKAKSAASFRRPTKVLEDALVGGRTPILMLPGAMPIEGGLPIVLDGKVLGAIGVSGVTAPQDGQIAKAGMDALPKILGQ